MSSTARPAHAFATVAWPVSLGPEQCTLVLGRAGSGKTTLLAQWFDELATAGREPAWVAATAGRSPVISTGQGAVGDLPTIGHRTVFVDDADHLDPGGIERLLRAMADERVDAPAGVVLASRALPDRLLDWSRHLSIRTVAVEDQPTPGEAARRILLDYRPDLTEEQLETLLLEIGSWPAAAHLAGQAIIDQADLDEAIERFDGHDLRVADYFDTEVFGGLDSRDQEFLVTCSVLPELSGDGCAMLTGDQLAAERLTRLGTQDTLVSASASTGTWRWQPLVRSYLLGKLRLRSVDEVTELRRRARGWSTAHQSYGEAIAQAGQTKDWDAAVRLILDIGMETVATGRASAVVDWIDQLPLVVRRSQAGLAVVAAFAWWALDGDDARATIDDWLAHARTVRSSQPPAGAPSTGAAVAIARSLIGTAETGQRLALVATPEPAAGAEGADDPPWSALRCSAVGIAAYLGDDLDEARRTLSDCLAHQGPNTEGPGWFMPFLGSSMLGLLALTEQDVGEYDRAAILISMSAGHDDGTDRVPERGTVMLARARQARREGDFEQALADLRRASRTAPLHWVRALALLESAELHLERGEGAQRVAALEALDQLMARMGDPPPLLARRRRAANREPVVAVHGLSSADELTERELEVLRLLDTDLTRRQIAGQLFLAHNTVKTYIQRLYQKLGVSSRPAALAKARERGWLP